MSPFQRDWDLIVPEGWAPVHYDPRRDVWTLERTRRWFKGAFWVTTGEALFVIWCNRPYPEVSPHAVH